MKVARCYSRRVWWFVAAVCLALLPRAADARDTRDLYCGKDNCYELLGLTRKTAAFMDAAEIKKVWRKVALKYHPDKNKSSEAEAYFAKLTRAHEVVSNKRLRAAYNNFLDNPDDDFNNMYGYYTAVYAPQSPVWAVVFGTVFFLTLLQFVNQRWTYASTLNAVKYQQRFQLRVKQLVDADMAQVKGKLLKIEKDRMKAKLKDKYEKQVMETEVELEGADFEKPRLSSLLLVRVLRLPFDLPVWTIRAIPWHYRFSLKREAYGVKEREYLTRRALGLTDHAWNRLDAETQASYVTRELWNAGNLAAFRAEQDEQERKGGARRRDRRLVRKGEGHDDDY